MTDSDLIELGMLIDTTMSSEGILDDMLVTAVRRLNGQDPDGALQAAYLDRAQDLGCLPAALDALAAEPESAPEPEGGGDVIGPNDPAESGTLVTPSDLLDTAGLFLACVHPGDTLLHHKGRFHSWNTGVWDPAELLEKSYDTITRDLWHWLRACEVPTKDGPPKELLPIPGLVDNVRGALLAKVEVGGETDTWRDGRSGGEHILSVDNGLLDIRTGELMPHTPAYFNTVRVRAAARDVSEEEFLESRWHAFLRSVFEDDDDQIRLLRQWFGYILQPDADLHGILALVGKPRSGKGVLLRALRRLLGPAYASVNSSDFGETFGLAQAIDTRVLALGDLRTSHKSNHAAIAERFLSVSGQDVQNIQRKYISSWCGVLKTKILLASNSIPDLRDELGVLATRFQLHRVRQIVPRQGGQDAGRRPGRGGRHHPALGDRWRAGPRRVGRRRRLAQLHHDAADPGDALADDGPDVSRSGVHPRLLRARPGWRDPEVARLRDVQGMGDAQPGRRVR